MICTINDCVNGEDDHEFVPRSGYRDGSCRPRDFPRPLVTGMGPEAPIETNEDGGSQSAIPFTFTTMPLNALAKLSELQAYGDTKYGAHNWRQVPETDHIDHAFAHLLAHCVGDRTDDHLTHAAWRLLAAVEVRITQSEEPK